MLRSPPVRERKPESQKEEIMKTTIAFVKNVVMGMVLIVAVAAAQEMQAPKPGPEMEHVKLAIR